MTARRIIPCLDVKDGRVVKGVRFVGHTDMGDAAELASEAADLVYHLLVLLKARDLSLQNVLDVLESRA